MVANHMTLHHGAKARIGELVNGKYELQEQIGAGAHGTVYRALQHPVGRTVALKFISKHLSSDPDNRVRFFSRGSGSCSPKPPVSRDTF